MSINYNAWGTPETWVDCPFGKRTALTIKNSNLINPEIPLDTSTIVTAMSSQYLPISIFSGTTGQEEFKFTADDYYQPDEYLYAPVYSNDFTKTPTTFDNGREWNADRKTGSFYNVYDMPVLNYHDICLNIMVGAIWNSNVNTSATYWDFNFDLVDLQTYINDYSDKKIAIIAVEVYEKSQSASTLRENVKLGNVNYNSWVHPFYTRLPYIVNYSDGEFKNFYFRPRNTFRMYQGEEYTAAIIEGINMVQANTSTGATFLNNPDIFDTWVHSGRSGSNYGYFFFNQSKLVGQELVDYVKKRVAMLGYWFTDNTESALNSVIGSNCTDEHCYCPLPPVDGYFTGEYTAGNVTAGENPWIIVNTNVREELDYDPDKIRYNDINVPLLPVNPTTVGTNVYAMNSIQLNGLINWLWYAATNSDTSTETLRKLNLVGDNPLNAVVSLKYIPFDIGSYFLDFSNVYIGYNNPIIDNIPLTATKVNKNNNSSIIRYDLGNIKIPEPFKNFLDYEPYTSILLYIPFCGFTDLSPSQVVGKTIYISLDIDFTSCNVLGVVTLNNSILFTKSGNCGKSIPLSGVNSAIYGQENANLNIASSQLSAQSAMTIVSGVGGVISGVMSDKPSQVIGNVIGTASNLIDIGYKKQSLENKMDYNAPKMGQTGTFSPNSSITMPLYPYLQINYPIIDTSIVDYINANGAAVFEPCTVGEQSGYCEFYNVKVDGLSCTEREKQLITDILQNGVYI